MKTLRAKLTLNTIFAACVLFLLGGAGFYFVFSYMSEDAIGTSLQHELLSTFRRIDDYYAERGREFDALAKSPMILSHIAAGGCVSSAGVPTFDLPFGRNGWERIAIVDNKGVVCATTGNGNALYQEEKNAISEALHGTHVQTDMISSGYFVQPNEILATPIISGTGTVSAVLVGRLSATELMSLLSDVGVPVQLLSGNGLLLGSTRPSDHSSSGKLYPDPVSVWNFAANLAPLDHGVMRFGAGAVIVAIASEPGTIGYRSKSWKLIGMQQNDMLYGGGFALLGAILFGLFSVLAGLIFFGRMPLRLVRELKQIAYYTEQQLRGITEFIPRDKEVELKSVYSAIERLATRYNVLARTRDDSVIKLAQDMESFREERDRYAVMIGAMREGAIALGNDGVITLCNLSAANIIGRNRDDIIGKHYSQVLKLYLSEDLGKEFDAFDKALLSGGVFAEEGPYYVKQLKGGGRPVRMQSTVIRYGADRAPIGIFVLMRDVEKELAVEQSKNEFISVTSHQMRTPLATMRWHLERLLKPGAPPSPSTLKDYLERIERNNKRMIRLADALLDVSRIDLDEAKGKDVEIDVPGVVKEVLDEIDDATLAARKITQNYDGIKGQKIKCDPYLVRVIFENFIENAIAYTKKGGTVAVAASVDGDSLRIDVRDDGIGISPEMKDKIFSKFVRGKNATSVSPEGTGLGLYITKSLVERVGGKIWFESIYNEGSTFSVRFPLGEPE